MKGKTKQPPAPEPEWATRAKELLADAERKSIDVAELLMRAASAMAEGGMQAKFTEEQAARHQKTTKEIVAATRGRIEEELRPKGPMVTVVADGWAGKTTDRYEVKKVTPVSIILHGGTRFRRADGWEVRSPSYGGGVRRRIEGPEMARVVKAMGG
jgi:hypothetical protein